MGLHYLRHEHSVTRRRAQRQRQVSWTEPRHTTCWGRQRWAIAISKRMFAEEPCRAAVNLCPLIWSSSAKGAVEMCVLPRGNNETVECNGIGGDRLKTNDEIRKPDTGKDDVR
jgi:hypothetical protein